MHCQWIHGYRCCLRKTKPATVCTRICGRKSRAFGIPGSSTKCSCSLHIATDWFWWHRPFDWWTSNGHSAPAGAPRAVCGLSEHSSKSPHRLSAFSWQKLGDRIRVAKSGLPHHLEFYNKESRRHSRPLDPPFSGIPPLPLVSKWIEDRWSEWILSKNPKKNCARQMNFPKRRGIFHESNSQIKTRGQGFAAAFGVFVRAKNSECKLGMSSPKEQNW